MVRRYREKLQEESDETPDLNHVDTRPILLLNDNKTDFYDFTIEDFSMVNYNPIKPQLKLELGI